MSSSTGNDEHAGLAFLVSIPMTIIQVMWGGFVITQLWSWFIVTTFVGVPRLNLAEAIGVDLVVSMFLLRRVASSSKEEGAWEGIINSLAYTLVMGALLLFMGFIVKGFI